MPTLTKVYGSRKGGISASIGENGHKQQGDFALARLSEGGLYPLLGISSQCLPSSREHRAPLTRLLPLHEAIRCLLNMRLQPKNLLYTVEHQLVPCMTCPSKSSCVQVVPQL